MKFLLVDDDFFSDSLAIPYNYPFSFKKTYNRRKHLVKP